MEAARQEQYQLPLLQLDDKMAQVDVSGISYFLPIVSFLLVFILVYAVLAKTKLLDNKWVNLFLSFLLATIFISAVGPREYIINIGAWFAVFFVSLLLIMLLLGLVGKDMNFMHKGIGVAFVILLILMFIISAIVVFSDSLGQFLPWSYGGGSADAQKITEWLYSTRVLGAILLIVVSAVVSWILVKAK